MLTKEQNTFISIIKDHLWDNETILDDTIDTNELEELAKLQQCQSIIYHQTKIPSLSASLTLYTYRWANIKYFLKQIHDRFTAANIKYLVFKGMEFAEYYPYPQYRTMSDIDILVHEEDREIAQDVLYSLGFKNLFSKENSEKDHEWIYMKGDFEIEIHHRLLYDDEMNYKKHIEFTDKAWENATTTDGIQYHLNSEFHFIFAILHLRKHFLWAGVGIRQFIDIALMIKNANLDFKKTEEYLSNLSLLQFAKVCFALIYRWFGIKCPIKKADIDESFYEISTDTILKNGVFGLVNTNDDTIRNNRYMNRFKKEKSSKRERIKMVIDMFFPGYSVLSDKFPKMKKLGFFGYLIIPAMWIHRAISSIKSKNAGIGINLAVKPVSLEKEITKREKILKQWGL